MIDTRIKFTAMDLEDPNMNLLNHVDLAISLEVAEHLKISSAEKFLNLICSISDVVILGLPIKNKVGQII